MWMMRGGYSSLRVCLVSHPLPSPLSRIIFSCICVAPHFLAVFHRLLSYITSLLDPLIPPCLLISLPLPLSHPKFLPLPRPLILLSFHYFFPIFLLASLFFSVFCFSLLLLVFLRTILFLLRPVIPLFYLPCFLPCVSFFPSSVYPFPLP